MATLEQIEAALRRADAQGNAEDARMLAQAYKDLRSQITTAPAQQLDEPGFFVGVGKGMNDVVRGVTGLFGDPKGLVDSDRAIDQTIAQEAPVGVMVGNLAATAPTMFLPGANTLSGSALLGAGLGYATNESDRGTHLIEGALGGAVGSMLPHVANVAMKALAPLGSTASKERVIGRALNRVSDPSVDNVIFSLENAQGLIPDSYPTAAEVANSGGIAAMQRAVSSAYPEQFASRLSNNAAARRAALQAIAGDEQKMQAAIQNRRSATANDYEQVHNQVIPSSPELEELLKTNAGQQAIANAKKIASNEYRELDVEKSPYFHGKDLHTIQRALGSMASDFNTDPVLRHSIGNVYGDYKTLLENEIPGLLDVNQRYAELSKPINQMQIGQELLNKLGDSLSNFTMNSREMKNRYATALNDVKGNLVKNATGSIQGKIDDIMTPEQMTTLKNIGVELGRKQNAEDLGRGVGSNTYQNLSMDGLLQAAGVPTWASGLLNVAPFTPVKVGLKLVGNAAYGDAEKTMKGLLADALLDPKETARLMRKGKERTLSDRLGSDDMRRIGGLLGFSSLN